MKTIGILCLFFCLTIPALPQGALTPPAGTPAPTMKKLDELEPRTNLQASPAPTGVSTTDPNYHFVISQPGSYYLSANLPVTKTNGIRVATEDVTIDLNGFKIVRSGATGVGDGITILATSHRCTIRNGSVSFFAQGINSLTLAARGCAFRDLSVSNCTNYGIVAGEGALLES